MSFTHEVIDELIAAGTAKTCCRKALLYGLFFTARPDESVKNRIFLELRTKRAADLAAEILARQFSATAEIREYVRAGREYFSLTVVSKALYSYVRALGDGEDGRLFHELVGYRCDECAGCFIRGVFIGCGSMNDPQKSYHLEFSLPDEVRAEKLMSALGRVVPTPKRVTRAAKVGVYYKHNELIFHLLNYMGGGQSRFVLTNTFIERDIRNAENRATNCVTKNISKAVAASNRQIEAIERLAESGKLLSLPEELRYTAELRLENPSATLFELAYMHEPPISKSGLNRRLTRLLEEADEKE
jgi:DNA-binding protein WhiA